MNKRSRDSDELETFNKYDERLLEDLALYCGLALQYAQAVQITEERRASIEVTQEVGTLPHPVSVRPYQILQNIIKHILIKHLLLQVLAYHITAAEQEIQTLQVSLPPHSPRRTSSVALF